MLLSKIKLKYFSSFKIHLKFNFAKFGTFPCFRSEVFNWELQGKMGKVFWYAPWTTKIPRSDSTFFYSPLHPDGKVTKIICCQYCYCVRKPRRLTFLHRNQVWLTDFSLATLKICESKLIPVKMWASVASVIVFIFTVTEFKVFLQSILEIKLSILCGISYTSKNT